MKIAYLVNLYPAPSHSFIRREILAHEAAGHTLLRFSIRRFGGQLIDPQDQSEAAQTHVLLESGAFRLFMAMLLMAMSHPIRFAHAVATAIKLSRAGQKSLPIHLIYVVEACLLRRRLAKDKVDHLHVHFGTNSAAVALLCRVLGGPAYSFTVHGPDEFDSATSLSLRTKIGHAAFTVAISQFGKSQLCRWIEPAEYHKCRTIHCGLDETFLRADPPPVGESKRLLFVGRLTSTKGIYVLLDAMKLLVAKGIACELAIIGDGPEYARIEKQIATHALAGKVTLLGWKSQDDVRSEMLRSRALVLPSFAEGLPVVLMESLALGRPVITTWIAGIPELVENGADGWLVPPGATEALAAAMEKALTAPLQTLNQMGRHGREKVLLHHNAATEAAKLARMFRNPLEIA